MQNKKLLKWLVLPLTLFLLIPLLVFSASAEMTLINYDDYATYSVSDVPGLWNVRADLPVGDCNTRVEFISPPSSFPTLSVEGSSYQFSFTPQFSSDSLSFSIAPLGGGVYDIPISDFSYQNANALDPSLIPLDTVLEFSFDFSFDSANYVPSYFVNADVKFYVAFLVDNPNYPGAVQVAYSDNWYMNVDPSDSTLVHFTTRFDLSQYPEYAGLPFFPFIYVGNLRSDVVFPDVPIDVMVDYNYLRLEFSISDAIKAANDSDRGDKLLGNIEQALSDQGKQLDDFLNNDVELDQGELGGAVDNIGNAEGELLDKVGGFLGEAPSLFSNIVSDLTLLAPSFAAVALIYNEFFSISFVSLLLRVSIGLGILAVVLNMAISIERAGYARSRWKSSRAAGKKKG